MKFIHMPDPDDVIYDFRTMVERVNARLKDEFGARFLRVRGAIKVKCHLMFGIVALAADQILRVANIRPAHSLSRRTLRNRKTTRNSSPFREFCKRLLIYCLFVAGLTWCPGCSRRRPNPCDLALPNPPLRRRTERLSWPRCAILRAASAF